MDTLAERLDRIHLRVRVPGMEIYGELSDRRRVEISFGEDTYSWLSESRLERELAVLARLLTAGWGRDYHRAMRECGLDVSLAPDLRNDDYEQARAELVATGASADGLVSISAVGLRDFSVHIRRDTAGQAPEQVFVASANEAAAAFLADHMAKIRELQRLHGG
ncbi:MAG TPA: hypothetical protein VG247_29350 [Pseudonocardiaceae bacterium]|jgi:hypothetical protein|nr:hypothetical protein [Pseudonocardiaceae bacterium]